VETAKLRSRDSQRWWWCYDDNDIGCRKQQKLAYHYLHVNVLSYASQCQQIMAL